MARPTVYGERTGWRRVGLLVLIGLGPALLYGRTLAPSVVVGDSAEFQTLAPQLGITHPTGYPLYLILSKAFTLFPMGDVAYRVNLFSAVAGVAAVVLLYLTIESATGMRSAALAGAWMAAVGHALWSQAVIAEVYTLNAALVCGLLYSLVRWEQSGDRRWLWGAALALGFGLANHRTVLLLIPGGMMYLLLDRRRRMPWDWRVLLPAVTCVVLPLALYLYIPLRWPATYGRPIGWAEFWGYVLGRGYGYALQPAQLLESSRWTMVGHLLSRQLTPPGVFLALLGLAALIKRAPRFALLSILSALPYLLFGLAYQVPDVEVFLIPAFLMVAAWVAGATMFFTSLPPRSIPPSVRGFLGVMPALACTAYLVYMNAPSLDRSQDWAAYEFGQEVASYPLERGALIICDFERLSALRYTFGVEKRELGIDVVMPDREEDAFSLMSAALSSGRAVYLARLLPHVAERYHLRSVGPLARVSDEAFPADTEPQHPVQAIFDGTISLRGFDARTLTVRRGEELPLTLHWQATGPISQPYLVRLRLTDGEGHVYAEEKGTHPVGGQYPLVAWRVGEGVTDYHRFHVTPDVPPGRYWLEVQMSPPFGKLRTPPFGKPSGRGPSGRGLMTPPFDKGVSPVAHSLAVQDAARLGQVVVESNPDWRPAIQHRLWARLGQEMALLGYDLAGQPRGGQELTLTLWVQALKPGIGSYRLHLQVRGPSGRAVWEGEIQPPGGVHPLSRWQVGEIFPLQGTIRLPSDVAEPWLELLLRIEDPTGNPVPIARGWLHQTGEALRLTTLKPQVPPRTPGTCLLADFEGRIVLLSYTVSSSHVQPGERLRLVLYWWATSAMVEDYTVFVHFLDPSGQVRWQQDIMPVYGTRPTSNWTMGEVIVDVHDIPTPPDIVPGEYTPEVGLYSASTWQRLWIRDAAGSPVDDHLLLEGIQVTTPY